MSVSILTTATPTQLGAPVYKRMGMIECGVGLSRYLWRNESAAAPAAFRIGGHEG